MSRYDKASVIIKWLSRAIRIPEDKLLSVRIAIESGLNDIEREEERK